MTAKLSSVWTLVSLSALIVVSQCFAAPTAQREDGTKAAAADPPLVRTKRADEMIFNAESGEASRVKKSEDVATDAAEQDAARVHDVTKGSDAKEPVSVVQDAEADSVNTKTGDEAQDNERDTSEERSISQDGVDSADAVATSSEDNEKRDDGDSESSLMLAENMEAQQPEQRLRAKRDLDADEIRQLFESQGVPVDDYSAPVDYTYDDNIGFYNDAERNADDEYDEDQAEPWQFDDDYVDDVEGRPKRGDEEQYRNEVEREALRELLAERAAEEARQALVAYLTAGERAYRAEEPQYLVAPNAEDLAVEEEEYNDLMNGDEEAQRGLYDEEPELTEKRFYPYSYEPYGGRWGALVPGAKRGDRDPYDRLYRLAEVLSRPAQLGSDVDDYKKK